MRVGLTRSTSLPGTVVASYVVWGKLFRFIPQTVGWETQLAKVTIMNTLDATDGRDRSIDSLDVIFDALGHSYRRTVIEELDRNGRLGVDELAERVAEGDDSVAVSEVHAALAHNHLSRLDAAGVITYDTGTQTCELDAARTVRAVLAAAREQV